jgi:GGDEF domain-containing protein
MNGRLSNSDGYSIVFLNRSRYEGAAKDFAKRMLNRGRRQNAQAGRSKFALSIRARLMVLATIAVLPLLLDRVRDIESDRSERVAAASKQALMLAHQGVAAQNEAIVSVRAFMQVAASAHGLMTTRGDRCDSFLTDAARQVAWLKSLSLVDPDGRIVCSSNPDVIGVNVSRLPHFARAMKTGEFALSDYFVGKVLGPTLLTALPHHGSDGAIDVIVSAPLELSWFTGVASTLAHSFGAVVIMVDRSGTLLAHQPSRESWVGRRFAAHPMTRAMLASPEGVFAGESFDGVRRIVGFVELPGTGARLAVGLDENDVLRRVNREILLSFAGVGIIIAGVLLAIWFGAERLFVKPIRSLTRTAQRLGHGEFDARAMELPLAAEFVPLAAALDDMAGRLADREQELRDSNGQLMELAYIDGLTGIANRRAFNAHLASEWQKAAELAQPVAVLILDVDHFKPFNDRYGHVQGDNCLRKVSGVLRAGTRVRSEQAPEVAGVALPSSIRKFATRDPDFTARYGGEEFAVLLRGADLNGAIKVAERLRRAVEDLHIIHEASPAGFVTISIGVASIVPAKGGSAQRLVEIADAGLYQAKRRGRNVVVAHSEQVLSQAS